MQDVSIGSEDALAHQSFVHSREQQIDRLRGGGMVKGLFQLSKYGGLIILERQLLQCGS